MTTVPEWQEFVCFPTTVYLADKPEFLGTVSEVCAEALAKTEKIQPVLDEIYPVRMTENLSVDPRLAGFTEFIGNTAWEILSRQGHVVSDMGVAFQAMWCQEHHKHSLMEQHTHGEGAQLVGFYFLETPEKCSRLVVHDPRAAKVQINLPEADIMQATYASTMINFVPKPGQLIITNAWLPHSFSRHAADTPIKFIHFNLNVNYQVVNTSYTPKVEIV